MLDLGLHARHGNRLYLNAEERDLFLAAARRRPARDRTICKTLHYTGCRPSELIELTPGRIDLASCTVAIRCLKKRNLPSGDQKLVFRTVPVPAEFLDTLNTAHGIREAQQSQRLARKQIWPISRVRVWQIVKDVMVAAGVPDAPHRSPKGLRHGFGINATTNGVPLHMVQKWMGHAHPSTTTIYANAAGKVEAQIASRMWGTYPQVPMIQVIQHAPKRP